MDLIHSRISHNTVLLHALSYIRFLLLLVENKNIFSWYKNKWTAQKVTESIKKIAWSEYIIFMLIKDDFLDELLF